MISIANACMYDMSQGSVWLRSAVLTIFVQAAIGRMTLFLHLLFLRMLLNNTIKMITHQYHIFKFCLAYKLYALYLTLPSLPNGR